MFFMGIIMNLDLAQAGIFLKCLCGAQVTADIVGVLFEDRGQVKIGEKPVRCQVCGAVYRKGERLKYRLVRVESLFHSIS
jgi:hypothetical protein